MLENFPLALTAQEVATLDRICDSGARNNPLEYADPLKQWAHELGRRERRWITEHEKGGGR